MQYQPDDVRAHLTRGPVLALQADLEPLRGVADARRRPSTKRPWTSAAANYLFRAKGSVPKFAGWMAVYNQEAAVPSEQQSGGPGPDAASADDEEGTGVLPPLAEGDRWS